MPSVRTNLVKKHVIGQNPDVGVENSLLANYFSNHICTYGEVADMCVRVCVCVTRVTVGAFQHSSFHAMVTTCPLLGGCTFHCTHLRVQLRR